ncbi:MAG: helix-turn-helix domain-containing protein [Candidatus Limnocylindria bacterium]
MTETSPRLGDVLRAAREARDLDLSRAERDTKIRMRYLTALEEGDYRELPGAVYVRGFLRNYGHYLGLDSDYLIGLYRAEAGVPPRESPVALPRPIVPRPRAVVLTPGLLVTVLLTLFVAVFVAYLAYEFITFAGTPSLEVTDPGGDVAAFEGIEYTIRGHTEPNSRITIEGLPENPDAAADDAGDFAVPVGLAPGVNVITITASDPRTGRDTEPVRRTITVSAAAIPSMSPQPSRTLNVAEPAEGATVTGAVPVAGETSAQAVTVSAALTGPPAVDFRVTDAAGAVIPVRPDEVAAPEPMTLEVGGGRYAGELALPPGTWELTVADASSDPATAVTRTITVAPATPLTVSVAVRGGPSWLELYEDELADPASSTNTSRDAPAGSNIDLSARRTIRIRAGSAGAVSVVVNGVRLGTMGAIGQVVDWTVTATS